MCTVVKMKAPPSPFPRPPLPAPPSTKHLADPASCPGLNVSPLPPLSLTPSFLTSFPVMQQTLQFNGPRG